MQALRHWTPRKLDADDAQVDQPAERVAAPRPDGALPDLGPHGEGWVAIQTAIAIVVLAAAPLSGIALASLAQTSSSIAGVALMAGGVFMFGWGTVVLGPSFSVWLKPRDDARLVVEGPYGIVRHPICTAQAIIGFGWALWWASPIALALAVVYAAYLDRFKLRREEQLLLRRYPAYALYRRQVPHRMLPVPGSAAVPSGPPAGGPSGGR